MVTITRALARTLRAVCRRAGIKAAPNTSLLFQSATGELAIQARSPMAAIQYRLPAVDDIEQAVMPFELLETVEGRTSDPVTIKRQPDGRIMVDWTDSSIPQMLVYPAPPKKDALYLEPPTELISMPAGFLSALNDATRCADRDVVRYALDHLQLRGRAGQIVATDGRQILRQGRFSFPWTDDLLVPALGVFGCSELAQNEPISIGRTEDWVVLRIEPWTIWLAINKIGRFPKVDDLIRPTSIASSRLSISPAEAAFVLKSLPSLPCDDQLHDPVTVELNGGVVLRARSEGQTKTTELVLTGSSYTGDAVTINTNRRFVAQALKLGFTDVLFFGPDSPALCDDGTRQYLWALLDGKDAIKASEDPVRIESPGPNQTSQIVPFKRRRKASMPSKEPVPAEQPVAETPTRRRRQSANQPTGSSIEQAIALRSALRAAAGQANDLIRSLKRQKRQTKLVASTLASLKELQKVAG